MIRKILSLIAFSLLSGFSIMAQDCSWVYFNKNVTDSVKSEILSSANVEVIGYSKWLNAACVNGCPKNLEILSDVESVKPLGKYKISRESVQETQEDFNYGYSDWQLKMIGLDEYHKRGFTGKGVTIGLFDAGFFRVDSLPAFDTLRKRGQILAEWDFHYNDTNVYVQDGHGMYVLSICGGYWPDSIMGAAPDANFLLARTEMAGREIHYEEYAWLKALEWADSIGVDIIHSSLGYSVFDTLEGDYSYMDMDGETTVITKGTDEAWNRGIFVTNSAGNEGSNSWHYITAPCDGKHVLCVGAVDSNQMHAGFSSYGPTYDGRIKPEVVAMGQGVTYVNKEGQIKTGSGTSFSGPIIAGMVACLKQAWPEATNQQIFNAIIRSADRYENPDTAYGYGLPNVLVADSLLKEYSVAIRDFKFNHGIKLFPNPGNGQIRFTGINEGFRYTVFDVKGRVVQENSRIANDENEIDFSELGTGMYYVELVTDTGITARMRYLKTE
ncbi:MAG: S8 family serine peptidase [Bacteroidetes bacterium]|nr:S8 family serine peptidase [Bacteroidota bacterium]